MSIEPVDKTSFFEIAKLIHEIAGLHMSEDKISLVNNRLSKRVRHHNLPTFKEYLELVKKSEEEAQIFVDLLTTHETSFFRESNHFNFLEELVKKGIEDEFRVWSAACSNGAEAYSIAITLREVLGSGNWSVLGSDISTQEIESAKKGLYPIGMAEKIPEEIRKKHFLKGINTNEGNFIVSDHLKERVDFKKINLNECIKEDIGKFDVVFLRNILIYFENEKKKELINRVAKYIKKGGYLFIGHSEILSLLGTDLKQIMPTVYQNIQ